MKNLKGLILKTGLIMNFGLVLNAQQIASTSDQGQGSANDLVRWNSVLLFVIEFPRTGRNKYRSWDRSDLVRWSPIKLSRIAECSSFTKRNTSKEFEIFMLTARLEFHYFGKQLILIWNDKIFQIIFYNHGRAFCTLWNKYHNFDRKCPLFWLTVLLETDLLWR